VKGLRGRQRFHRPVGLYQDGAVRAHGERGAQLLLGVGHANTHRDDLRVAAALLDAQRFLQCDLIEGIDAHFHAVEHDAAAVRLDADAHVVIDHPLDANHNFLHFQLLNRAAV
jgi:hypothetical protein